MDPEYDYARSNLASLLIIQGKYGEAIIHLEEFRKLQPESIPVWEKLCEVYYKAGNKKQCRIELNGLLKKDPGSMRAYIIRGQLNLDAGDKKSAIRDFNYALDIARVQGDQRNAHILAAMVAELEGKKPAPTPTGVTVPFEVPDQPSPGENIPPAQPSPGK